MLALAQFADIRLADGCYFELDLFSLQWHHLLFKYSLQELRKGSKDENLAFTDLVATWALPLFLGFAVLIITRLNWRCTQTKPVIFLDNAAQFQDSAVLCQDLPVLNQDLSVLNQDLSVLATLLRVVNNTHRKRERMNKQEHQCA